VNTAWAREIEPGRDEQEPWFGVVGSLKEYGIYVGVGDV